MSGRRVAATLLVAIALGLAAHPAAAQVVKPDSAAADELPMDKGLLALSTVTVTLNDGKLQIVFIPLDERVLRLVNKDSYRSMQRLLLQQKRALDSVASATGVNAPGIAFVSFQGLAPSTRFEPEQLTLSFHGQQIRPIGWIALSPTFANRQVDVRQQVQALFLYRRDIPVRESFSVTYLDQTSDDWANRLPRFETERVRIIGTTRTRPDTTSH